MNSIFFKILIILIILLKYDFTFAKYFCVNKAIFFGNDGKDINLDGNSCYYSPKSENGESSFFIGGNGGDVNVENGAVVFGDGIKSGTGGLGSIIGGNGGNINFEDKSEKLGNIYENIEAGEGGSGFFKPGKGGDINNYN